MSRPERAVVADNEVQELVAKARKAQAVYEGFSQEQVDAIVRDMAKYVYDNAETLARMAVDETGIGNYEDKILKKKGKARVIWNSLKGKKSRGIIGEDPENNLVFVAKPMGVVAVRLPRDESDRDADVQRHVRAEDRQRRDFRAAPEGAEVHGALDERVHEDRQEARRPRQPGSDDQEGLGRENAGAHAVRRRRRRDRRRRDGEVGVLVRQAVVRRRRRQRPGDHRSRRGLQGRRRQDRDRRGVRQRHHLLARAVRVDARGAIRRDGQAVQGHRQGLVHRRREARSRNCASSCSPTAT